ncbi:outer membrane protein [Bartonella australis AUST/NH1]|uniref:Outer membrane protein n=1 Tax=Bartonella australis (strain Aust/NH1) TaxID=1094489 RepID=M1N4A4_BARAA|nr:SIMPL domain-containing protein [Bartonella australis]AGF74734.1 outer membrane protein [Bartonella australis AUST/NH1]
MTKKHFQLLGVYRVKVAILAALAFLTVIPSAYALVSDEDVLNTPNIRVTATGESQAVPDMAIINLGVVTHDKTAQQALAANNKTMNDIINSFKNNGIHANDLQTMGLSIHQSQSDEQQKKKDESDLYQVSNSLTVRIRNLADAGKIFDQAIGFGVNSVSSIIFANVDTKPLYEEARKKAVTEAMKRAETLAHAAGVKLGKILEINEYNSSSHRMSRMMSLQRDDNDEDTNFLGGELNYSVTVNVAFAIDN